MPKRVFTKSLVWSEDLTDGTAIRTTNPISWTTQEDIEIVGIDNILFVGTVGGDAAGRNYAGGIVEVTEAASVYDDSCMNRCGGIEIYNEGAAAVTEPAYAPLSTFQNLFMLPQGHSFPVKDGDVINVLHRAWNEGNKTVTFTGYVIIYYTKK